MHRLVFSSFLLLPLTAQETRTESFLSNLAPIVSSIQRDRDFPMDYAHRGNVPVEEWRGRGRAELERSLSYSPRKVPVDVGRNAAGRPRGNASPAHRNCGLLRVSEGMRQVGRVETFLFPPVEKHGKRVGRNAAGRPRGNDSSKLTMMS